MVWHLHLHIIADYLFHKPENNLQKQTDSAAVQVPATQKYPEYSSTFDLFHLIFFTYFPTASAFHHHFCQKLGICKSP